MAHGYSCINIFWYVDIQCIILLYQVYSVQLEKGVWEYLVRSIELGPYSTPFDSIGPRILLH
jgi:hypothetical protein